MKQGFISTSVMVALLSGSVLPSVFAQTRPAPGEPQILPVPERPVTRPIPPRPNPGGGPQIQPPRPNPGGPQIQPPRPNPGGPQIQPPRPNPGGPQIQPPRPYPGDQYGRTIRCESRSGRTQRCSVRTENRVQLVRRLGGNCTQGRTWGYNSNQIWVSNGCRAEFAYGRNVGGGGGQYPGYPRPDRDKGPSTGAIIAGVAVAGGLIALLASSGKKKDTTAPVADVPATFPPGPPAALSANLAALPSDARPSVQTCLHEAARQIGATGGSRVSYDKLVSLEPGNGGWRFGASLTASYPDGNRTLPLYCRATPTKIIQFDFANQG